MLRYSFARAGWKLVQLALANVVVTGKENIPTEGPFLVTTNHMSVADTPLLFVSFPTQEWRFFAGEKWQDHWIWGPMMGWLGAIYINRNEVDRRAIQKALTAIEQGAVFGLAPEGKRSKSGEMQEAKTGAAYLASRGNVPIVPVAIVNSDILFDNVRRLKRTTVEVHIGEPYYLPDLGRRARSADLDAYTRLIMVKIAGLLPERYHGVYRDSPALKALLAGQDPWPYCQAEIEERRRQQLVGGGK
jgi:1-acyl-sn-glycerol-3-phosphate acyltransferase